MKIVLEVRSQVYLQVNNFVTTYYSPFFVRWSSRAWTKGWLLRGVWLLCLLVFVCLTIKVIGSQKSWWAVFVNQSCSINILTSKLQLWSVNIFVLSIVKQLGVTPDVRGVTAGPAMMQLNQVSLRKVLQLKMFPGLSYLVVAASPRQGCLLERRRCWGGWVLLWVVLWLVPPNVRRFEHFAGESKNIKQNMLMNTISHPHIASAPCR